ncbi:hypothetical protein B0H14DRAFT_2674439 [Mycena olivaceomarginata]|nr:hypothetical protein B0H14DRAFT_2674439 [Mycena olivaceomarginata]
MDWMWIIDHKFGTISERQLSIFSASSFREAMSPVTNRKRWSRRRATPESMGAAPSAKLESRSLMDCVLIIRRPSGPLGESASGPVGTLSAPASETFSDKHKIPSLRKKELQWHAVNLCMEFYAATAELLQAADPVVVAQCYPLGAPSRDELLRMVSHAKSQCESSF